MNFLRFIGFSICFIAASCGSNKPNFNVDLVISNINVIDGTGSPMQSGKSVVVKDGRILAIVSVLTDSIQPTKVIDGTGKFLIPGLIDAHVHLAGAGYGEYTKKNFPETLNQLLHFGVTSILIPGGSRGTYENVRELKSKEMDSGWVSPRIHYTSLICTPPGGHPAKTYGSSFYVDKQSIYFIEDSADVAVAAKEAREQGAFGIKIILEDGPMPPLVERMSADLINYFSQLGDEYDLPVLAHVSDMEEVRLGVENEVDAFMHFAGVQIDWDQDQQVIDRIAARQLPWVTTLMIEKSFLYPLYPNWLESERIVQNYPQELIDGLRERLPELEKESRTVFEMFLGTDSVTYKQAMQKSCFDIKRLHDEEVKLVLGTDVGGRPFIFPGYAAHEEMSIYEMAGIPPLEIIKIATQNGAEFLTRGDELGTLEPGKLADMIILNSDPLEAIQNTLAIDKVFKAGLEQKRLN